MLGLSQAVACSSFVHVILLNHLSMPILGIFKIKIVTDM